MSGPSVRHCRVKDRWILQQCLKPQPRSYENGSAVEERKEPRVCLRRHITETDSLRREDLFDLIGGVVPGRGMEDRLARFRDCSRRSLARATASGQDDSSDEYRY